MNANLEQVKAIFLEAVEKPAPEGRNAYLQEACGGDANLRQQVEVLLQAHESGSLLDKGAIAASPTIDQPITEKPGTQIGPYKLLQQIGEGGMGVVYRAEQKEPVKRREALKIIKPGMDTRQVIARFEAERQALAMMDHPNIAKVLHAGQADSGKPYFVMELVNGLPVTKYCDEQHLTPKERLELFVPICRAVQHAHQKGIIHRDLKPSNILVALYDGQAVPKIIDFGVAKATGQTLTEKTMFTQLGQVVGTLEYMSPEQAERNQLDIDTRSDIYSLGVVLYELLVGDTPFDRQRLRSAAFDEMLRIIREEDPPKPSTKLSSSETLPSIAANRHVEPRRLSTLVRGELDWIVMKALEKDRARRYETASKFAEDVQHYLNDEPLVACPPSRAYKFCKFARRNKAALVMASVVAAALVVGLLGTTWLAIRATMAEKRTRIEQEQTKTQRDRAVRAEAAAQAQAEQARQAAEREKQLAQQEEIARRNAQQHLYDAHMNLAQTAYDQGRRSRVLELLSHYSSRPGRDTEHLRQFEWYYWWRQCHRYSKTITVEPGILALSPDGKTVVVDRQLWDVASERLIGKLYRDGEKELEDAIAELQPAVDADPDDTKAKDDLQAAKDEHFAWRRKQEKLCAVTFAPDGRSIATMSRGHDFNKGISSIRLWDVATLNEQHVIVAEGPAEFRIGSRLKFSPDSTSLAAIRPFVSKDAPQEIHVWDATSGQVLIVLKPNGEFVPGEKDSESTSRGLAFSPDSAVLAIGGFDEQGTGIVRLWDLATGQKLRTLRPKDGEEIPAWLMFSPHGKKLLARSYSDEITVWDVANGEIATTAKFAETGQISPDGRLMTVSGNYGSLQLWDVASETQTATLLANNESTYDQAFSQGGTKLVSVDSYDMHGAPRSRGSVKFWDLSADRLLRDYVTIPDIAGSWGYNLFAFSPDSRTVACCNKRGTVDLWDTDTYSRVRILHYGYFGPANAVAFAPDGDAIASAGRDLDTGRFRVDVRDLRTGSTRCIGEHANRINSLEFTQDGHRLASADAKGSLQVWDLVSGNLLLADPKDQSGFQEEKTWQGSSPYGLSSELGDLSFSPDGTAIAFLRKRPRGENTRQAIVSLATGELKRELDAEKSERVVAYSPDGRLLAIGGGMAIRLVDCKTWQARATMKGHMRAVNGLAFSPDAKRLASTSEDQVVLWNAATQTPTLVFAVPGRQALSSVAFSPDGRLLALAGGGVMRVYRTAKEQEVAAGRPQPEVIPEMELADACRRRHVWDEAIVHYTRAIEQTPDDDAGWWGRARCYVRTDELDSAFQDYQRVVDLWRKFGVDVATQRDMTHDLTQLAQQWQTQGRREQALEVHRLALQQCQVIYDKALRLKRFPLRLGSDPDARHVLRTEVTKSMLALAGANRRLGHALTQAGDPSAAAPYLRASLGILADTEVMWPSDIDLKMQIEELARRGLVRCLNDQARKQTDRQAAIPIYREAIELSTDGGGPHNNLGLALRATGDFGGAISEFQKAITYLQKKVDSGTGKSLARKNLQVARNNLAATYAGRSGALAAAKDPTERDAPKAVELARKAIELDPDDANHWNNLGVAQYRAGNCQAAVEALEKADGMLEGGDRVHRMFFAMARWQLGDKEKARELYVQGAAWIAEHRKDNEEQYRFGAEAEELMGIGEEDRRRWVEEYLARQVDKTVDAPKEKPNKKANGEEIDTADQGPKKVEREL